MKENKKARNDIIFVVLLLGICIIGIIYLFVLRDSGDTVKVTVDGELYGTYSLSQNIVENIITGENNEHYNKLVIKDKKAYVEIASCPDGICVSHRPIFRDGESIVCLPNKVVVSVILDNNENSPDVVV